MRRLLMYRRIILKPFRREFASRQPRVCPPLPTGVLRAVIKGLSPSSQTARIASILLPRLPRCVARNTSRHPPRRIRIWIVPRFFRASETSLRAPFPRLELGPILVPD